MRVAPSSPIDLIQAISDPTSIPVLAKGKDTLMNTSDFLLPRTLAIVSNLSGIASNAELAWKNYERRGNVGLCYDNSQNRLGVI